jgi:hypothetical protein
MTENYSKIFKGVSYTDEENITGQIFFIAVSTISLVLLSFINFHMFHLSVEIFSALISFAILMISINTYNISKNDFFMFLGIGYTFVGMLDLLHAFSYSTMDIMPNASVNMVAQFWESARLYELVTVLISSIIVRKKIVKPNYLLTVLFQLLIFICIIWANVNLNSMPFFVMKAEGRLT